MNYGLRSVWAPPPIHLAVYLYLKSMFVLREPLSVLTELANDRFNHIQQWPLVPSRLGAIQVKHFVSIIIHFYFIYGVWETAAGNCFVRIFDFDLFVFALEFIQRENDVYHVPLPANMVIDKINVRLLFGRMPTEKLKKKKKYILSGLRPARIR